MPGSSVGIACFLFVASVSSVSAQSPATESDERLPREAQLINGVLVPVPDEIFRVLDTFRNSNWNAVLRPNLAALQPTGGSARIALSLGLVIGEGFLAVAAEDDAEIQDLGKTAIKLARALGVEKSMLRREKSIVDYAGRKDWTAVRKEWAAVSADIKEAMIEIKSEPLSQLVSLGGWLRGVDALSALVLQHYSVRNAQFLYQPMLLDSFEKRLSKLKTRIKADPVVAEMESGVSRLQTLIGNDRQAPLSEREVSKIRAIATELIKSVAD